MLDGGELGEHDCATGEFGTCAESLAEAEEYEQCRSKPADLAVCGEQAQSSGRNAHESDGDDHDDLAAVEVADAAQDDGAQRASEEADGVGCEG